MDTKEFRKKWVEALRSGKYKQGKSRLRRADKYCCLGVACEIYNQEIAPLKVESKPDHDNPELPIYYYGASNDDLKLPQEVRDFLKISDGEGLFTAERNIVIRLEKQTHNTKQAIFTRLSHLNDFHLNFEQIADLIESEPTGLFQD